MARALLDRIVQLGGFPTHGEAAAALKATLLALGESLPDRERKRVADALSVRERAVLQAAAYRGELDTAELYDRVRSYEGVALGFAREHAQVVCRAIGELLDDEVRALLDRVLPEELALLFHPRVPVERSPETHHAHSGSHHTLATGRPGSSHPVSESAPPGAQSHSVARESNPHGDTKLSSAHGMTQESVDESLATSHPNAHRTIAGAGD